jgi:uncharacterized protein
MKKAAEYRIISADGGGIRGLITAGIMSRISDSVGDGWIRSTDLFAGTSTGALITLALACGKTPAEIVQCYERNAKPIFHRRFSTYAGLMGLLWRRYPNDGLKRAVAELFPESLRLGDVPRKVLVASFQMDAGTGKGRSWKPKIFHNFDGDSADCERRVRDVCLFSSAAPIYLPSYEGFIDGGVCANNPSMCALAQLLDERYRGSRDSLDGVRMISFGTGNWPEHVARRNIWWGLAGYGARLVDIFFDGSNGIADYQCARLLGDARYRRIQPDLAHEIGMDEWKAVGIMREEVAQINLDTDISWLEKNWKSAANRERNLKPKKSAAAVKPGKSLSRKKPR